MVPAPTIASGTSAAAMRIASIASRVRRVISTAGSPPFASARASGAASAARAIFSTGITGWPVMRGRSLSAFWGMRTSFPSAVPETAKV